jgi:hypothetical protein
MSKPISLQRGVSMTTLYRLEKEEILEPSYRSKGILPICETFDKKSIQDVLSVPGCEQVRIYYGMESDLTVHAILVAVDAKGQDILPTSPFDVSEEEPYLWDDAARCPTECPPPSTLNS